MPTSNPSAVYRLNSCCESKYAKHVLLAPFSRKFDPVAMLAMERWAQNML